MSRTSLSRKTVYFKGMAGGPSPTHLSKLADHKESKSKGQANHISFEKRMPINIFNIKNVNYLNTEPHDTSQSIFKNEAIKDKRVHQDDSDYLRQLKSRKEKRQDPKALTKLLATLR